MTISNETRGRVKKIGEPIALFFGRLGLTPDGLTLIGFGITTVGAVLLGLQLWVVGGLVVFAGGVFDMFDGTLARATGQVSKLGAFMDSVFDRWGEALVYVGLVAGLRRGGWAYGPFLAAAAMAVRLPRQLRPGQVGGARLLGRHRHGRGRGHAPRDPPRDPVRRPRPRRPDRHGGRQCRRGRRGRRDPARDPRDRRRAGDHRDRRHAHRHPARPPHARPGPRAAATTTEAAGPAS